MKTAMLVAALIIAAVIGYYLHPDCSDKIKPQTEVVIIPDYKTQWQNDSLKIALSVRKYVLDSLRRELIFIKQNHEKDYDAADTLPAPVLFSKIAAYYNKQ